MYNINGSVPKLLSQLLQCNDRPITWQHLMTVYKQGTGADRPAPGLALIPKLIDLTAYMHGNKKQVLSESVANALKLNGRAEYEETILISTSSLTH